MLKAFPHLLRELRLLLTALQFFSRVPVPAWVGWSAEQAAASVRYLPAVGWLVGAVLGAVLVLALHFWSAPVAVGLAMWASLWLTGAFHEDGFADCCDALGGHHPPERALEIMKDPRVGSYAVVGLLLLLGLKAALWLDVLEQAGPGAWALLLAVAISSQSVSRLAPLILLNRLDYVRPAGSASKSQAVAGQRLGLGALAFGALLALEPAAGLALLGWPALNLAAAVLAALAVALLAVPWLRRRLGGQVGDALGATQQVAEIAFLLGLSAA